MSKFDNIHEQRYIALKAMLKERDRECNAYMLEIQELRRELLKVKGSHSMKGTNVSAAYS